MQYNKIISYAKINISLGVIKKLKSKLHQIESLISFIDLYDEILIKKAMKIYFDDNYEMELVDATKLNKSPSFMHVRKHYKRYPNIVTS